MILVACSFCKTPQEANLISRQTPVPVGWYRVDEVKAETMDRMMAFLGMTGAPEYVPEHPTAFCSLQCLAAWAMLGQVKES